MTEGRSAPDAYGEPRLITGRERRKDDREWADLYAMAKTSGHEGHAWKGVGVPPHGHLTAFLYTCSECEEFMFATLQCTRSVCPECFPEGPVERLLAWWRDRRRRGGARRRPRVAPPKRKVSGHPWHETEAGCVSPELHD